MALLRKVQPPSTSNMALAGTGRGMRLMFVSMNCHDNHRAKTLLPDGTGRSAMKSPMNQGLTLARIEVDVGYVCPK